MKKLIFICSLFVSVPLFAQLGGPVTEVIAKEGGAAAAELSTRETILRALAATPFQEAVNPYAITGVQVLNSPYLNVSEKWMETIAQGQSAVGLPQYNYARTVYQSNPLLSAPDIGDDLRRAVAMQMAKMIDQKYPGTPNPLDIAQEASEGMEEYIISYNGFLKNLDDAPLQTTMFFSSLEQKLELTYRHTPEAVFEGEFVRTFEEVTEIFRNGNMNALLQRNISNALTQAREKAVEKDAGFLVVKVGERGQNLVKDVLILDLANLRWISYAKNLVTLRKIAENLEQEETGNATLDASSILPNTVD